MVNMNHHKEPCIYGLYHDGRLFYVGYTSVNALNRWWQHRYRANSGHDAPVYQKMREVGTDNVTYGVIRYIHEGDNAKAIEAETIAKVISEGVTLYNQLGRDGVPDSVSPETRIKMGLPRKGKPTWIKGKRGEEAGWTEDRKAQLRERAAEKRRNREPNHGTITEYRKYGCRCSDCSEAMRAYYVHLKPKGKSVKRVTLAHERPTPRYKIHGEVACYKNGKCRCDPCTTAYREYKRTISKTPEDRRRPHQYKQPAKIELQTSDKT